MGGRILTPTATTAVSVRQSFSPLFTRLVGWLQTNKPTLVCLLREPKIGENMKTRPYTRQHQSRAFGQGQ